MLVALVLFLLQADPGAAQMEAATRLSKAGKYAEALALAREALALREQALGPEAPETAAALHRVGTLLWRTGDNKAAEPLLRRALAVREKALGPGHLEVAATLNNLGELYHQRGEHQAALALLSRAVGILERARGPEHPDVALAVDNLGSLYEDMGRFEQAEPLLRRALAIREKALGPNHNEVARSLHNLAMLITDRGDYQGAEAMLRRGLAIRERALGPDHPELGFLLQELAWVLRQQGQLAAAEPLLRRARAIREKALGPDHPSVAASLGDLAILLSDRGDYAEAESTSRRALAITEKAFGPDNVAVATALSNLADLLARKGDDAGAEPLARRALAIRERKLGPEHIHVATSYELVGTILGRRGQLQEAVRLVRRAVKLDEKLLGPDHPDLGRALSSLGSLYFDQGQMQLAEPLFRRALAIRERALGPHHRDVATTLDRIAAVEAARERLGEALALRRRLGEIREQDVPLVLAMGSEAAKLAYMTTLTDETDQLLALSVRAPALPGAVPLALETLLRRKGRVLDTMADGLATLRRGMNAADRALLDRLASVRGQLGALALHGSGRLSPEQARTRVARLESEAAALEAQVSERSAPFKQASQPVTLAAVQAAIPDGAALVELARYRPFDPRARSAKARWGSPRYAAYTLVRTGAPGWVDLGAAEPIESAVQALRRALAAPATTDARALGRDLDQRVMRPLRARLGAARTLWVAADGPLSLLPLEALVDEDDHYLIERFSLAYLPSGRDLIAGATGREPSRGPPVLVADPSFDAGPGAPARPAGKGPFALRSGDLPTHFGALPGTAAEARALGRLLPDATLLTGERATESALKRLAGPRILHIATHGFFLADQDAASRAAASGGRGLRLAVERAAAIENPLLRSGLALSGANRSAAAAGDDDGILTALEAASLDLRGTRLVVLSACETGVGEVRNGEGIYGLRRALAMAGAQALVMSLWKVDDASTQALMVDFYRRLGAGVAAPEALRQARLALLGRAPTAHPYYWASFILSGR